jgi:hypothetical protein
LRAALGLALAAACCASPALAASERMISFEPASAEAKRLTGAGITIRFVDRLRGQRVTRLLATAIPAQASLSPAGVSALGGLTVAKPGVLYALDEKAAQGPAYVRAFCPGSHKVWLAIGPVGRKPLTIQALGDDPKGGKTARLCATMEFAFKGEWALPPHSPPDPMEETRDLEPY